MRRLSHHSALITLADDGGDDEAEPDSEREFGHGEARLRRVRPHMIAGNTCAARRQRPRIAAAADSIDHESGQISISARGPSPRRAAPAGAKCLTVWRSCAAFGVTARNADRSVYAAVTAMGIEVACRGAQGEPLRPRFTDHC